MSKFNLNKEVVFLFSSQMSMNANLDHITAVLTLNAITLLGHLPALAIRDTQEMGWIAKVRLA